MLASLWILEVRDLGSKCVMVHGCLLCEGRHFAATSPWMCAMPNFEVLVLLRHQVGVVKRVTSPSLILKIGIYIWTPVRRVLWTMSKIYSRRAHKFFVVLRINYVIETVLRESACVANVAYPSAVSAACAYVMGK